MQKLRMHMDSEGGQMVDLSSREDILETFLMADPISFVKKNFKISVFMPQRRS